MTEYIEKNKAIKELYEVYDYEFPTASGGFDEYARMIVPNTIKNMPAADVEPVVRCAQCKHFKRNLENDTYCSSVNGLTDPQEDDFCSYGEKRGQ